MDLRFWLRRSDNKKSEESPTKTTKEVVSGPPNIGAIGLSPEARAAMNQDIAKLLQSADFKARFDTPRVTGGGRSDPAMSSGR